MSFLPRTAHTAAKTSGRHDAIDLMIAIPLTLAGTAFLAFLLDVGSRLAM